MDIHRELHHHTCEFTLSGPFTFSDHPGFRTVLDCFRHDDIKRVVLHLGRVEFVDSAALGMLLLANDEAQKHGKSLLLRGAQGQVQKMFALAHFGELMTLE